MILLIIDTHVFGLQISHLDVIVGNYFLIVILIKIIEPFLAC